MSWQADEKDATSLLAIRLLSLKLEYLGTTIYITDRTKYSHILTTLKTATSALRTLTLTGCSSSSDCPDGYVCTGSKCEPENEAVAPTSQEVPSSRTSQTPAKPKGRRNPRR